VNNESDGGIDMHESRKALVLAAAGVAVALTCLGCGASAGNVGVASMPARTQAVALKTAAPTTSAAPTRTAAPTSAATPTPTAMPSTATGGLPDSDPVALAPGRYTIASQWGVPPSLVGTYPRLSFAVPSGWLGGMGAEVGKTLDPVGNTLPFLWAWDFDHGYKNPCTDHTPVVPAAGSGPAGLLRVLAGEPGLDAGPVRTVTVGGHRGAYVDYIVLTDSATCGNGQDDLWIWGSCPVPVKPGCEGITGDRRFGASKGDRERAYAIDVDGAIYTFFTARVGDLTAAGRADQQRLLDSIQFLPPG
jgi:hypothetical protein